MRLLLVGDHPLFLEGMRNLLTGRGGQVVGTARDGYEALAAAQALQPDVILMDLRMPKCDGLTATALIKAELPAIKVVVLTMSADDADLFQAIRLGASGYLLKSQDIEAFFRSLEEVAHGEVVLAPGLAQRLVVEFCRLEAEEGRLDLAPQQEGRGRLSSRQEQILTLVGRGLTYKEVGCCLGLAERTVKYHMGEILTQLHLKNRAEAVAYARAHRLDHQRQPVRRPNALTLAAPLVLARAALFTAFPVLFRSPHCTFFARADSDKCADSDILYWEGGACREDCSRLKSAGGPQA